MNLLDPETLAKLAKIVLTDIVLAGDNALVIALATRMLLPRQQFWGRILGAGGAVGLRVLFVFAVTWITRVPVLQLAAGLLLVWIAWKLVRPGEEALAEAADGHSEKHKASSLWDAVRVIIVADIVMSLDNVIAIAGIAKEGGASEHGEMWLVIFGLLLSIPLVVCGSALISKLMNHHRWLVWLGGGVLGHVAGGIIFKDPQMLAWLGVPAKPGMSAPEIERLMAGASPWVSQLAHGIPWALAVSLFLYGWWWSRQMKAADGRNEDGAAA
jgi:YjbE family integral membrane protein